MILAAYESSNFWYRELVKFPEFPTADSAYGSNRDTGLSVPFPSLFRLGTSRIKESVLSCISTLIVTTALIFSVPSAAEGQQFGGLSDTEILRATQGCEAAFNNNVSSGSRCLLGHGLNLALDEGLRLANEHGKDTFGENFQLVGDLSYRDGLGLQADLDTVIPLASANFLSDSSAASSVFFQYGLTRWMDSESGLRNDFRYGIAHRFRTSEKPNSNVIGLSVFHVRNAEQGHELLVSSIDYGSHWGGGSLTHYLPRTGWLATDGGYLERATGGAELGLRLNLTSTIQMNLTGYRRQSQQELGGRSEGVQLGLGWQPHKWFKLTANLDDKHNGERSHSIHALVSIPFESVTGQHRWEGLGVSPDASSNNSSYNLWRPVENVGRIRTEKKQNSQTATTTTVNGVTVTFLQDSVVSGETLQIELSLSAPASSDVNLTVRLVPGEGDNPAVAGEDFLDQYVDAVIAKGTSSVVVSIPLIRNENMQEGRSLGVDVSVVS